MKTFRLITALFLTFICISLTSCSKDDDNKDGDKTAVTITNNSSETLTNITFVCYDSKNDDEDGDEQDLSSLKKGDSHKFKLPNNCNTWFIVCYVNGVQYESDDYKSESLSITDKVLNSWYHR